MKTKCPNCGNANPKTFAPKTESAPGQRDPRTGKEATKGRKLVGWTCNNCGHVVAQ